MHHQTSQYIVREWRPNPYNLAGVILHCNYDGYTWLLHFPNPSSHIDTPGASYTISRAHWSNAGVTSFAQPSQVRYFCTQRHTMHFYPAIRCMTKAAPRS